MTHILAGLNGCLGERPGKRSLIERSEMLWLCESVRAILATEPTLVEYQAPAQLYGDIHGQFYDLLKLFENFGWPDGKRNHLFLGDYGACCVCARVCVYMCVPLRASVAVLTAVPYTVDRGKQSLETLILLFALKVKYPTTVCLLRGNHEDEKINCLHGFLDECTFNHRFCVASHNCSLIDWFSLCGVQQVCLCTATKCGVL